MFSPEHTTTRPGAIKHASSKLGKYTVNLAWTKNLIMIRARQGNPIHEIIMIFQNLVGSCLPLHTTSDDTGGPPLPFLTPLWFVWVGQAAKLQEYPPHKLPNVMQCNATVRVTVARVYTRCCSSMVGLDPVYFWSKSHGP